MRAKLILFIAFLSISVAAFPQLKTYQRIEVGINGIATSLEIPLSEKIIIEPAIGVGPSYDLNNHGEALTDKIDWHWALLEPSLHLSAYGKFFYNRNKRSEKNKTLLLNSGNYIGVKVKYVSKSFSNTAFYSNTLLVNLHWGGQRNIGKHWIYSYSIGMGYGRNMDHSYSLVYPAFDMKIAYVLPLFSKVK